MPVEQDVERPGAGQFGHLALAENGWLTLHPFVNPLPPLLPGRTGSEPGATGAENSVGPVHSRAIPASVTRS